MGKLRRRQVVESIASEVALGPEQRAPTRPVQAGTTEGRLAMAAKREGARPGQGKRHRNQASSGKGRARWQLPARHQNRWIHSPMHHTSKLPG
jgi:hypothetical protein